MSTSAAPRRDAAGTAAYIVPFVTLLVLLAALPALSIAPAPAYIARTVVVAAALLLFSRRAIDLRTARPLASILAGLAIFAVWIAPDLLWPGYREHWLFRNALMHAGPAVPDAERTGAAFLFFRIAGSALIVPVVEELFWRGWMMRWLISPHFEKAPLGAYTARAFWITALLFASEHGAYWDVGLAAGIAFNWWMIRTRSLGDCILAHVAANAALAVYVLAAGKWEYWL